MIRNATIAFLFTVALTSAALAGGFHGGGGGFHGGGGGFHGGGFHGGGFHGGGFHGGGFHGRGWSGPAIGLGLGLGALGAYGAYDYYTRPSPCPYGYYLTEDGVCYPGY